MAGKTNGAIVTTGAAIPVSLMPVELPAVAVDPGRELERLRFMPLLDIQQAVARRDIIVQATAALMQEGIDYGKIPGSDRPVLLQPGADKLANLFGLVIRYSVVEATEDWTGEQHGGEPFFYYKIKARAFRGDFVIGEGIGSCNSWESKYRWRKMERSCPTCSKETIRKSNRPGEGWYCWAKIGGCGAKFPAGEESIESQIVGRKPNPDMADTVNTVLKMAYKRAKVSCTVNATSASEFFTQDIEDSALAEPDTGGHPVGTQAAADYVAERKIAALGASPVSDIPPDVEALWKRMTNSATCTAVILELRDKLIATMDLRGAEEYDRVLTAHGVTRPKDIKSTAQGRKLARALLMLLPYGSVQ